MDGQQLSQNYYFFFFKWSIPVNNITNQSQYLEIEYSGRFQLIQIYILQ